VFNYSVLWPNQSSAKYVKKVVVAYFKVLYQHMAAETEKKGDFALLPFSSPRSELVDLQYRKTGC
jgi:hypothetical protein